MDEKTAILICLAFMVALLGSTWVLFFALRWNVAGVDHKPGTIRFNDLSWSLEVYGEQGWVPLEEVALDESSGYRLNPETGEVEGWTGTEWLKIA